MFKNCLKHLKTVLIIPNAACKYYRPPPASTVEFRLIITYTL